MDWKLKIILTAMGLSILFAIVMGFHDWLTRRELEAVWASRRQRRIDIHRSQVKLKAALAEAEKLEA